MNKNLAHRLLAFCLSLMVMFSTISFSVEKRYCGTDLIDVAVLLTSHNHDEAPCSTNEITITKSDCCKDIIELVKRQEIVQNNSFEDFDFSQQDFFTTYVYTHSLHLEYFSESPMVYDDYSPPELIVDRTIQHQVFQI